MARYTAYWRSALASLAAAVVMLSTAPGAFAEWHRTSEETANGVKLSLSPAIPCNNILESELSPAELAESEHEATNGEAKIEETALGPEYEGVFWRLRAVIRQGHLRRVLTQGAGCALLPAFHSFGLAPGWEAQLEGLTGKPTLLVNVTSHRSEITYRLSVEMTAEGTLPGSAHSGGVIGDASVSLHSEYTPATRVWEGTDEYVNYCIDRNKEITSIGLRLGCWKPPVHVVLSHVHWR